MRIDVQRPRAHVRGGGELPRPLAATVPYMVIVPPGALVAGLAGLIQWQLATALAAAALLGGFVRAVLELVRRARLRDAADAWLLGENRRRPGAEAIAARREELVSHRQRRSLGRSVTRLVRDAQRNALPGASPANLRAAAAQTRLLNLLAARLQDLSNPVSPAGVVLTLRLLTQGDGPLYDRRRAEELGPAIDRVLLALEEQA